MWVISGNPVSTLDNRSLRQQMTSTHDNSGLMVHSMCGRGPPLQRKKTVTKDGKPYAVQVVSAGGVHADTMLRVRYRPRLDRKDAKEVSSNGAYGKTWNDQSGPPTTEDQEDFLHWIESGMGVGHLGGSSPLPTDAPPQPAARSSSRLSDKVAASVAGLEAEVKRCVDNLVDKVVTAAGRCRHSIRSAKRCLADPPAARAGPVCRAHASVRKRIASGCAALSLRQAERKQERRKKAAELLQPKLTVDAEWLQEQIDRISHALMSDTEAVLLPEGDYSDHQRSRLAQQASVTLQFYHLLLERAKSGADPRELSADSVYDLAERAGNYMGGYSVDHRTVRAWHYQYFRNGGTFDPDGCASVPVEPPQPPLTYSTALNQARPLRAGASRERGGHPKQVRQVEPQSGQEGRALCRGRSGLSQRVARARVLRGDAKGVQDSPPDLPADSLAMDAGAAPSLKRARARIASLASRPLYFVCPRTFRASARPSVVCDCAARPSNLPLKPTHVVLSATRSITL